MMKMVMLFLTIFLVLSPVNISALVYMDNDGLNDAKESLEEKPYLRDYPFKAILTKNSKEPVETDFRNLFDNMLSLKSEKSNAAGVNNRAPHYIHLYYYIFLQPYIGEKVSKGQKNEYDSEETFGNVPEEVKADLSPYKEVVQAGVSDGTKIHKEVNHDKPYSTSVPDYNISEAKAVFDEKQYSDIFEEEKSGLIDDSHVEEDTEDNFKGKYLGSIKFHGKRSDMLKSNNDKQHSEAFELNEEKNLNSKLNNGRKQNNDTATYVGLFAKPFKADEKNSKDNEDSKALLKTAVSLNNFRYLFDSNGKYPETLQLKGKGQESVQPSENRPKVRYLYFFEPSGEHGKDIKTKNIYGLESEASEKTEKSYGLFRTDDPTGSRPRMKWIDEGNKEGTRLSYLKTSDGAEKQASSSKQKRQVQPNMEAKEKEHGSGNRKEDTRAEQPLNNSSNGGGKTTEKPPNSSATGDESVEKMSNNSTIRGQIPVDDTSYKNSKGNGTPIEMTNNGPKRNSTLSEMPLNDNPAKEGGFLHKKTSNNGNGGNNTSPDKPNTSDERKSGNPHKGKNIKISNNEGAKLIDRKSVAKERMGNAEKISNSENNSNNEPKIGNVKNISRIIKEFHHNPMAPNKVSRPTSDVKGKNAFSKHDSNDTNSFSLTQSMRKPKEAVNLKMGYRKHNENPTESVPGKAKIADETELGKTDNRSIFEGKRAETKYSEATNHGEKIQNRHETTTRPIQTIINGSSGGTQTVNKIVSNNSDHNSFRKEKNLEIPFMKVIHEENKMATERAKLLNESSTIEKGTVMPEKIHLTVNRPIADPADKQRASHFGRSSAVSFHRPIAEEKRGEEAKYRTNENNKFNATDEIHTFNVSKVDETEIAKKTSLNYNNGKNTSGGSSKDIQNRKMQVHLHQTKTEPTEIVNGDSIIQKTVIPKKFRHSHNHSKLEKKSDEEATYRANGSQIFNERNSNEAQAINISRIDETNIDNKTTLNENDGRNAPGDNVKDTTTMKTFIPFDHVDKPPVAEKTNDKEAAYRTNENRKHDTMTDQIQAASVSSSEEAKTTLNDNVERNSEGSNLKETPKQIDLHEMTTEQLQTYGNTAAERKIATEANLGRMDDQSVVKRQNITNATNNRMKRWVFWKPKHIIESIDNITSEISKNANQGILRNDGKNVADSNSNETTDINIQQHKVVTEQMQIFTERSNFETETGFQKKLDEFTKDHSLQKEQNAKVTTQSGINDQQENITAIKQTFNKTWIGGTDKVNQTIQNLTTELLTAEGKNSGTSELKGIPSIAVENTELKDSSTERIRINVENKTSRPQSVLNNAEEKLLIGNETMVVGNSKDATNYEMTTLHIPETSEMGADKTYEALGDSADHLATERNTSTLGRGKETPDTEIKIREHNETTELNEKSTTPELLSNKALGPSSYEKPEQMSGNIPINTSNKKPVKAEIGKMFPSILREMH